jgi:hypothetical protein
MVQAQPAPCPETSLESTPRELDSRASDGIHVQLLWHPHDGHLSVAVNDTKNGEAFELVVPDASRALEVFHHPYSYSAALRD